MDIGTLLSDARFNISCALTKCADQTPEQALSYISSAQFQIEKAKEAIEKRLKK